jgi:hypothetical protein
MGIAGWVFKVTKKRYHKTFTTELPDCFKSQQHVTVIEAQKWIKVKPEYVKTVRQYKSYITKQAKLMMRNVDNKNPCLIVLFDKWTPKAKKIMTHTTRDKNVMECYVYDEEQPVLDELQPDESPEAMMDMAHWLRYTTNRELVRRELYPIIYNAFIDEKFYMPQGNEQLILHGLPGAWQFKKKYNVSFMDDPSIMYDEGLPELTPRARIRPYTEDRDPDLYNRVFCITLFKGTHPPVVHRYQWSEAANNIGEADLAITAYWKFFRDAHHLIYMDDGDSLPICLLHAFDRLQNGHFMGKEFWICKSRKGASGKEQKRIKRHKKPKEKWTEADKVDEANMLKRVASYGGTKTWAEIESERPKHIYINVNALYLEIMGDPRLRCVQNPIVFYVCAIILTGTDFFGKPNNASFIPGIGQEKVIWPTLFNEAEEFAHMFQATLQIKPDPCAKRQFVLDFDAFQKFIHLCYLKANNTDSLEQVRATHTKREQKRKRVLSAPREANVILNDDQIGVCAGNLLYNVTYWMNGGRPKLEQYPNIFDVDEQGLSYYGFDKEAEAVATKVSGTHPFPVDDVYTRFFFKNQPVTKMRQKKIKPSEDINNAGEDVFHREGMDF